MTSYLQKIKSEIELKNILGRWRENGEKIVFTNGCFDILHTGHIDYLEKSKKLGNRLIIGVNSDESVKRLKGEERPVNDQNSRMSMLGGLESVDAVVMFSEDTPLNLIGWILPDVLVKGSDHKKSNIVGADIVLENGGKLETIRNLEGYSTTNIINRIKG